MYCRICGDERNVSFRPQARQSLCDSCAADTPAKVGRAEFDRVYWRGDDAPPCEAIRREFYSDYLTSTHNLAEYVRRTTSAV
jgi:hypothetical protein